MLNFLVLWVALSTIVGVFGRKRKLGFWGFFFLSLALSPLLTFLALLLTSPDTSESA